MGAAVAPSESSAPRGSGVARSACPSGSTSSGEPTRRHTVPSPSCVTPRRASLPSTSRATVPPAQLHGYPGSAVDRTRASSTARHFAGVAVVSGTNCALAQGRTEGSAAATERAAADIPAIAAMARGIEQPRERPIPIVRQRRAPSLFFRARSGVHVRDWTRSPTLTRGVDAERAQTTRCDQRGETSRRRDCLLRWRCRGTADATRSCRGYRRSASVQ